MANSESPEWELTSDKYLYANGVIPIALVDAKNYPIPLTSAAACLRRNEDDFINDPRERELAVRMSVLVMLQTISLTGIPVGSTQRQEISADLAWDMVFDFDLNTVEANGASMKMVLVTYNGDNASSLLAECFKWLEKRREGDYEKQIVLRDQAKLEIPDLTSRIFDTAVKMVFQTKRGHSLKAAWKKSANNAEI